MNLLFFLQVLVESDAELTLSLTSLLQLQIFAAMNIKMSSFFVTQMSSWISRLGSFLCPFSSLLGSTQPETCLCQFRSDKSNDTVALPLCISRDLSYLLPVLVPLKSCYPSLLKQEISSSRFSSS